MLTSAATKLRVLVVEDLKDAADTLALLLRLLGHEARVAYNGPDGLRVAREWLPDYILSDVGLPGMDGWELARQLRSDPGTARAHLIAVTAYGTDEDRRRSREAGYERHLVKPLDPNDLLALLARPRPPA
jgi:CheY-like chemotaxis protein